MIYDPRVPNAFDFFIFIRDHLKLRSGGFELRIEVGGTTQLFEVSDERYTLVGGDQFSMNFPPQIFDVIKWHLHHDFG